MMHVSKSTSNNVYKQIFLDHWPSFKKEYPWFANDYYDSLVSKLLDCGNPKRIGYAEYQCTCCGVGSRIVPMSCKSYLCLSCAKGKIDKWVCRVSRLLHPGIIYWHVVLTVPEVLRNYFFNHHVLLKKLPQGGVECLDSLFSATKRKKLTGGYIVVLQTHGRSGSYNVHLHIIATGGGIDLAGNFSVIRYLKYEMLHKKWQEHLLNFLSSELGAIASDVVYYCQKVYPNGFVAYIDDSDVPARFDSLAKYLAKYVVAPPISVRRIDDYDGINVTYHYKSHKTERIEKETVPALAFMNRIVQHVMLKRFNNIRHFGIQAGCKYRKIREKLQMAMLRVGRIIRNGIKIMLPKRYKDSYFEVSGRNPLLCPYCGNEMELWKLWHPKCGIFYEGFTNVPNLVLHEKNGQDFKVKTCTNVYEQLLFT